MPSIPHALQVGPPATGDDAPRDAVVRLQSSHMWLRTIATMLTTRADRHRVALAKAETETGYKQAAEQLGIDPAECIAILDRLLAALETPKPTATKKKRSVK